VTTHRTQKVEALNLAALEFFETIDPGIHGPQPMRAVNGLSRCLCLAGHAKKPGAHWLTLRVELIQRPPKWPPFAARVGRQRCGVTLRGGRRDVRLSV
jgi:hypothetical protein